MFRHSLVLYKLLALGITLSASKSTHQKDAVKKFPDGFLFGTATASYQIEGAWDADGKSPNIWDTLTHQEPCPIKECHTGDIADDSYHKWERDVEMMRELGLDFYRFSLSWSRILPTGFPNQINEAGVQYYNNLINEMLKYNIQPMATLYHWDLPQKLQDMGGWANPYMIDWFGDYARTCYELFGDRVKNWITINEPHEVCYQGYSSATLAPLYSYGGYGDYLCAKTLLLSHAKAYHIYHDDFEATQQGTVGIALSTPWYSPATDDAEDISAAEDAREINWGLYANPIFSENGDYPEIMKKKVAEKSSSQGYPRSRLPEFTPEEVDFVRETSDYFGINHYTTNLVQRDTSSNKQVPSMEDDVDVVYSRPFENPRMVPWGFYELLTDLRIKYNNPAIFITENGYSTPGGLEDDDRVSYYVQYISAMINAIEEGSDIRGYAAWSLMDNFEWMQGYTECYGLYEVDYSDPTRPRTPRKSAFVYKEILRTRQLDPHYEPPADRRKLKKVIKNTKLPSQSSGFEKILK